MKFNCKVKCINLNFFNSALEKAMRAYAKSSRSSGVKRKLNMPPFFLSFSPYPDVFRLKYASDFFLALDNTSHLTPEK